MSIQSLSDLVFSWGCKDAGLYTTEEILGWIREKNVQTEVSISKCQFLDNGLWLYDEKVGCIRNNAGSFFSISGLRYKDSNQLYIEQPIILQHEIGYLGIIAQKKNGILHLLMQAKIEPGNVNQVQISPTIQATKSNFTQMHGGGAPAYLSYFLNAEKHEIIVDQIQSEQASRFLGKRNRNILIVIAPTEEIEVSPNHCWMTLGQVKELLKCDNLVNMDTRTVLSCIPFYLLNEKQVTTEFNNKCLFKSIFADNLKNDLPYVFRKINDVRMFDTVQRQLIPLDQMTSWEWRQDEFVCSNGYHFKLIFCDIAIEGREVKRWKQPLLEAVGIATFGLLCCEVEGMLHFLVRCKKEIGSFDGAEIGPTVQLEADEQPSTDVEKTFFHVYHTGGHILHEVLLSEEGGRFYHEQNRNIILSMSVDSLQELPQDYCWLSYKTLNQLIQFNNVVNIQLRNLLALLEV